MRTRMSSAGLWIPAYAGMTIWLAMPFFVPLTQLQAKGLLIYIAKPRMIGYPSWHGSTAENGMSE